MVLPGENGVRLLQGRVALRQGPQLVLDAVHAAGFVQRRLLLTW